MCMTLALAIQVHTSGCSACMQCSHCCAVVYRCMASYNYMSTVHGDVRVLCRNNKKRKERS